MPDNKEQIAQNLGFQSTEDAARQLGSLAGAKHDQVHPKPYLLSVKATAEILATQLALYPEVQPAFVEAYRKSCFTTRKSRGGTHGGE